MPNSSSQHWTHRAGDMGICLNNEYMEIGREGLY